MADDDLDATLERRQALQRLRRAILSLPRRYREVIVLCDLQDVSYIDASAALGCAVGTIRSRLHRARHLLTQKMARAAHQRRGSQAADNEVRGMKRIEWGDTDLADALEALRQDEARIETPAHVETAVLAAWDAAHAPQHRRAHEQRSGGGLSPSRHAVIVAVGLGLLGRELQRDDTEADGDRLVKAERCFLSASPFSRASRSVSFGCGCPASTLTETRRSVGDRRQAAHVDVDVIVGEDGIARAIRVGM